MPIKVLMRVFARPVYVLLASIVALGVFAFAVWLPNFKLISTVFLSASIPLSNKLALLWGLFGSIQTNFTLVSAGTVVLVSILFGMQVALLVYYIRRVRISAKLGGVGASGLGGLISGMLGVGCAACGTFILTSLLALFGISGLLLLLPFGGEEFVFLGIGLLLYSIYQLMKKIEEPIVCPVT